MRNRPPDPNTTLRIQRTLAAPRELVFRAWTQPEMLRRWWGIEAGYTTPIAEVDLRVGGKYRLGMQPPNQDLILVVGGTYREVTPPSRLVYTWAWEKPQMAANMPAPPEMEPMMGGQETLVTVEFNDRGGSTELVITHQNFPDAQTRDMHIQGWSAMLPRVEQLLESGQR